jgi:hypothetical protein
MSTNEKILVTVAYITCTYLFGYLIGRLTSSRRSNLRPRDDGRKPPQVPVVPNPILPRNAVADYVGRPQDPILPPEEYAAKLKAREDWNLLDSNGSVPCPDCGETSTHPAPGCYCPARNATPGGTVGNRYWGSRHINRNHHTCPPKAKA